MRCTINKFNRSWKSYSIDARTVFSRKSFPCVICPWKCRRHYNDVIMGAIASQITSLTIVYSTVYSDADQRKHQSSASLAFVRGIHRGHQSSASLAFVWGTHRGPVNSSHKWPVTRQCFHLMTSSWVNVVSGTDDPASTDTRTSLGTDVVNTQRTCTHSIGPSSEGPCLLTPMCLIIFSIPFLHTIH